MGLQQSPINLETSQVSSQLRPLAFKGEISSLELRFDGRSLTGYSTNTLSLTFSQKAYQLKRIVIHSPSEHQIDHLNFDVEIQLEHEDEFGERLHLAFFANEAQSIDSRSLDLGVLPTNTSEFIKKISFSLPKWLPTRQTYLHYIGSLTYPPCEEKVKWIVMIDPVAIAAPQIKSLVQLTQGHRRPLQALGQRLPLRSR